MHREEEESTVYTLCARRASNKANKIMLFLDLELELKSKKDVVSCFAKLKPTFPNFLQNKFPVLLADVGGSEEVRSSALACKIARFYLTCILFVGLREK